jgi:hypothetical protein
VLARLRRERELRNTCSFAQPSFDFFDEAFSDLQAKYHVVEQAYARVQCVVQEHHDDVAFFNSLPTKWRG